MDSWRGADHIENDELDREILVAQGNNWTIKITLASDEPSISAWALIILWFFTICA